MIPTYTATPDPYALNREAELDLIIGRMVRQIMSFERQPYDAKAQTAIKAIKDEACKEAERRGLDAYEVWKVANSMMMRVGP